MLATLEEDEKISDRELLELDLIQEEFFWRVKRFLLLAHRWLSVETDCDPVHVEIIHSIDDIWKANQGKSVIE
ncbi:hypothetical protein [Hahella ganghwensis]|uniref:hypothetical protein n=1 Tax=Hahella ganghwensis TaxID=286420 RepID=UPI00036364E3|nr:hypothetical protein [Hahella ganghwensis]